MVVPVTILKDNRCIKNKRITIDDNMTFKQLRDSLLTNFHSIENITQITCVKKGELDLSSEQAVSVNSASSCAAESMDSIPEKTMSILLNVDDGGCTMREPPSIELSKNDFQIIDAKSIIITKQTVMEKYSSQLKKEIHDNTQICITASQEITSMDGSPVTVILRTNLVFYKNMNDNHMFVFTPTYYQYIDFMKRAQPPTFTLDFELT